jgi:hypothetical protein
MRHLRLLALALTAACASGSSGASSAAPTPAGAPANTSTTSAAPSRQYMASLAPTGSTSSRMSGTITVVPLDASTYNVTMDLRSGPGGKQLPWAIRPGPCGDTTPNSEVGGRGPYSQISTQADGSAHANLRIHVQLPDGPLHIDIMQSNSQRDVILTCGPMAAR